MAKILTPEKKAQLKKAVLDSIDERPMALEPKSKMAIGSVSKKSIDNKPKPSNISSPRPRPIYPKTKTKTGDAVLDVDQAPQKASRSKSIKIKIEKNTTTDKTEKPSSFKSGGASWDDGFFKSKIAKPLPNKNKIKMKIIIAIIVIVAVVIGFFAFDVYAVYSFGWNDGFSSRVASVLPLSAAEVNGKKIPLKDYLSDLKLLSYALSNDREGMSASSTDLSLNASKQNVLDRLVSIAVAKEQLIKYNKSVSDTDLDNAMNNLVSQFGNKDEAQNSVKKLYGINLDQFKVKILKPLLERDLLQASIVGDVNLDINKKAKELADDVLKLALQPGVNFSELAKQYTNDEAGINTGGDIGYVNKGELPENIEKELFSWSSKTAYNKVVKNGSGYHIFYVENHVGDGQSATSTIKLREIFIKIDVNKYIQELISSSKIKRFIK